MAHAGMMRACTDQDAAHAAYGTGGADPPSDLFRRGMLGHPDRAEDGVNILYVDVLHVLFANDPVIVATEAVAPEAFGLVRVAPAIFVFGQISAFT